MAERLRRRAVDADGHPGVTLSGGVATFPQDAADPSSLTSRADGALYASKHAGRDRLTVAGSDTQRELATT